MKQKLTLSIEKLLIDEAKKEGLNISKFVQSMLSVRYQYVNIGWVKKTDIEKQVNK